MKYVAYEVAYGVGIFHTEPTYDALESLRDYRVKTFINSEKYIYIARTISLATKKGKYGFVLSKCWGGCRYQEEISDYIYDSVEPLNSPGNMGEFVAARDGKKLILKLIALNPDDDVVSVVEILELDELLVEEPMSYSTDNILDFKRPEKAISPYFSDTLREYFMMEYMLYYEISPNYFCRYIKLENENLYIRQKIIITEELSIVTLTNTHLEAAGGNREASKVTYALNQLNMNCYTGNFEYYEAEREIRFRVSYIPAGYVSFDALNYIMEMPIGIIEENAAFLKKVLEETYNGKVPWKVK